MMRADCEMRLQNKEKCEELKTFSYQRICIVCVSIKEAVTLWGFPPEHSSDIKCHSVVQFGNWNSQRRGIQFVKGFADSHHNHFSCFETAKINAPQRRLSLHIS